MRQTSKTVLSAAMCPVTEAIGKGEPEALDAQQIVLWTLLEKFGGEVVCSTLGRHLAQTAGPQALGSDRWLQGMLAELEHCGALTLDAVDETEIIARLSPHGAALLDMKPAFPGALLTPLTGRSASEIDPLGGLADGSMRGSGRSAS